MLRSVFRGLLLLAGLVIVADVSTAAPITVYSNAGSAPGDAYTNAGTSNQGQAVGVTGWYYNNVRNNGVSGISTQYAHSGDGSARLQGTQGPGGASSKADIEYLGGGMNVGGNFVATASLGQLNQLTSLAYEWYKSSASTNAAVQHPSLRILIDVDGNLATTGDRGALIFERAYNGSVVPTDVWNSDVIDFNATNLWSSGLGVNHDVVGYNFTLNNWLNGTGPVNLANAAVLGFSAGIGSGWGPVDAAVDNISFGFNGASNTYNFEVAPAADGTEVPEPASLAVWGLVSIAGAAYGWRRKRHFAAL